VEHIDRRRVLGERRARKIMIAALRLSAPVRDERGMPRGRAQEVDLLVAGRAPCGGSSAHPGGGRRPWIGWEINARDSRPVEADRASALAGGAGGTSTIFLDGLRYRGSYEREELRRALSPSGEVNA
jgi:hypothetical protein